MARRKTKKEQYPRINKYYYIPLTLCGLIILAGIIMTITDQTGFGFEKAYQIGQAKTFAKIVAFSISGPSVIASGLMALAFLSYFWFDFNKKVK